AVLLRQEVDVLHLSATPQELLDLMRQTGVAVHDRAPTGDTLPTTGADYYRLDVSAALEALALPGALAPLAAAPAATPGPTATRSLTNTASASGMPGPLGTLVNGGFNQGADNLDGWSTSDPLYVTVNPSHQAVITESPFDMQVDLYQD